MKKKDVLTGLVIALCALLLSLSLLETYIRMTGTYDENGNFYFNDQLLKPYRLPVQTTQEIIAEYLTSPDSRLMYDPDLGWSPRPHSQSRDGLYLYNSLGIRSAPTEYSLTPEPGIFRIALFGDSYTHGDDVSFEQSWGYYLEKTLQAQRIPAEVINFGISGYGMDQAFLRWRKLGRQFEPDLVIFGFEAENVNRNVNVIRSIYKPNTGLPLAKPRFTMTPAGLELVNSPVLPPEEITPVLKNMDSWPLARYEYFYSPADYGQPFWLKSKVIAFLASLNTDPEAEPDLFTLDTEAAQLTLKIIDAFRTETEAAGQQFLVVHLPRHSHMKTVVAGEKLSYADLLAQIDQAHPLVPVEENLRRAAETTPLDDLFEGHYSPQGNQVIAEGIAEFIASSTLVQQ